MRVWRARSRICSLRCVPIVEHVRRVATKSTTPLIPDTVVSTLTFCFLATLLTPCLNQHTSHNKDMPSRDYVFDRVQLKGSCACGKTGFVGTGPSTLNFVCHCVHCRTHSKQPSTRASAFVPRQVQWTNAAGMTRTPSQPRSVCMLLMTNASWIYVERCVVCVCVFLSRFQQRTCWWSSIASFTLL
jgi:hypothetical protein